MKILIASPLYPPDIAEPAPYIKELATRLSKNHIVTLVIYGQYPELVTNVRIVAVSKRYPAPIRIILFTIQLFIAALDADVLYAENGTSVELPAAMVALISHIKFIFHIGDMTAHSWVQNKSARKYIERFALTQASVTIASKPLLRPEILPFSSRPTEDLKAYETSWNAHVEEIKAALS